MPAVVGKWAAKRAIKLAIAATPVVMLMALFFFISAGAGSTPPPCGTSAGGDQTTYDGDGKNKLEIPPKYFVLYHQAASKFKMDWTVLAAVGWIEMKHGTIKGDSGPGAQGPMQFMPGTWPAYRKASGDPPYDVYDAKDAIFAAAMKLSQDSGANRDYSTALFAYNHAGWYVSQVMAEARKYGYPAGVVKNQANQPVERSATATQSHAFPLPKGRYELFGDTWGDSRPQNGGGQTHEGTDIMAAKGTPVLSPVDGKVDSVGWSRLGGWRIGITDARGIYFYLAHLRKDPSQDLGVGDRVKAGQQVGEVGNTGEGPVGHIGGFLPHLHFGMYDRRNVLGDASRRPSGAVNPYPYLKEYESGAASQATGADSGDAPCIPVGEGEQDVDTSNGTADDLLKSKNVELSANARRDLQAGIIDKRLVRVLVGLSEHYDFAISVFKTGHSRCVGGGNICTGPSNHWFGRAGDIPKVDGKACITNPVAESPCGHFGRDALAVSGKDHPTEVIFAVDLDGSKPDGSAAADHADHVHMGFDD